MKALRIYVVLLIPWLGAIYVSSFFLLGITEPAIVQNGEALFIIILTYPVTIMLAALVGIFGLRIDQVVWFAARLPLILLGVAFCGWLIFTVTEQAVWLLS